ncbi:MAG: ester cyclase [Dehalococcoidia bacterium]
MSADAKALAKRLYEDAFGGDLSVIDEIMTSDPVDHTPLPGLPPGREGYRQTISVIRAGFPDMKMNIEEVIAGDDRIVARWTARGTHKGDFLGVPASGKSFEIGGISILTTAGGKISGDWTQWDSLGLMTQIGAIPAAATA